MPWRTAPGLPYSQPGRVVAYRGPIRVVCVVYPALLPALSVCGMLCIHGVIDPLQQRGEK